MAVFSFLFGNAHGLISSPNSSSATVRVLSMDKYPALVAKVLDYGNRDDVAVMRASFRRLEADVSRTRGRYHLPCVDVEPPPPLVPFIMNDRFLAILRKGAACSVDAFMKHHSRFQAWTKEDNTAKSLVTAALHVRRGDLESSSKLLGQRFLGDAFYFDVAAALRRAAASLGVRLDVHAWTSCVSADQCSQFQTRLVNAYRAQGIALHVDDERNGEAAATRHTLIAWSHFIRADVFVMSPSSFSQVPAMFSSGCVVFSPRWRRRHDRMEQRYTSLPGWIVVDARATMTTGDLRNRTEVLDRQLASELPVCLKNVMLPHK
jgi:hypothetical protein